MAHFIPYECTDILFNPQHPYYLPELEEEELHQFRYCSQTQELFLATCHEIERELRIYRFTPNPENRGIIFRLSLEQDFQRWNHLELSADGKYLVGTIFHQENGKGGGTRIIVLEGENPILDFRDPIVNLRYSDHTPLDQYHQLLHPDSKHLFTWTYADQMLRVIHLPSRNTVFRKGIKNLYAMNLNPQGDKLIIGKGLTTVEILSLPELKPCFDAPITHRFGYYYWADLGFALNQKGDLMVGLAAKERSSYVDIQVEVKDRDSRLVVWRKKGKGKKAKWVAEEGYRFKKDSENDFQAGAPFAFKAFHEKIWFAGVTEKNRVFWMEFPSGRTAYLGSCSTYNGCLFFSQDGSTLYTGEDIYGLNSFDLDSFRETEPLQPFQLEFPEPAVRKPAPQENWHPRWNPETATLDLTNAAISDLTFLSEIPNIEVLILDDSDVLQLPDLEKLPRLRRLSLAKTLVTDFSPLAGLHQLEELNLRESDFQDNELLAELRGLRILDLSHCPLDSLIGLRHAHHLRELYLEKSPVQDLAPLEKITALEVLDLRQSEVTDLTSIWENQHIRVLKLRNSRVTSFAVSPHWKRLEVLDLRGQQVDTSSLAKTNTLKQLDLSYSDLPDFSFLNSLTAVSVLKLNYTSFDAPELLREMKQLEVLDLRKTPVKKDLEFLQYLPLKELHLEGNRFSDLSPLQSLTQLRTLELIVKQGKGLGKVLKRLTELETLIIREAEEEQEGERQRLNISLGFLANLKKLRHLTLGLHGISDLKPLNQSKKLVSLQIFAQKIGNYHSLSDMENLEVLYFSVYGTPGKKQQDIFSGLPRLQSLEVDMGHFQESNFLYQLPTLKRLTLEGYTGKSLDFLEKMPLLQELDCSNSLSLVNADALTTVPDLRKLKLRAPVDMSPVFQLSRIRSVVSQEATLDLAQAKGLNSLRELYISGEQLLSLAEIPPLAGLRKLVISGYVGERIKGLENLAGLRELELKHCECESFPDLSTSINLQRLNLQKVILQDSAPLGSLRLLRELEMEHVEVPDFDWLRQFQKLKRFRLYSLGKNGKTNTMMPLWSLPELQYLSLDTPEVTEITAWDAFKNLSFAWLALPNLIKVPKAEVAFPRFAELILETKKLKDFHFLAGMQHLRQLELECKQFSTPEMIPALPSLTTLSLDKSPVADLTFLEKFPQLRSLDISRTKVKSISPLIYLKNLRHLEMEQIRVKSFQPLKYLSQLEWLDANAPENGSLLPLANLWYLETLAIQEGKVKSLEPLFPLVLEGNLTSLFMHGLKVKNLPEGLSFDRYGFIPRLRKFMKKREN